MDADATPNAAQPKSRRHWYQFALRTLLIGVTLAALPCAYVAHEAEIVRKRTAIRESSTSRFLCTEIFEGYQPETVILRPTSIPWLRRVLGDKPISCIFFSDTAIASEVETIKELFPEAAIGDNHPTFQVIEPDTTFDAELSNLAVFAVMDEEPRSIFVDSGINLTFKKHKIRVENERVLLDRAEVCKVPLDAKQLKISIKAGLLTVSSSNHIIAAVKVQ